MSSGTLVARAPTRLDFGGGWTDVPPYPAEQGGFVCNVAVARYATATLRPGSAPVAAPARATDDALAEAAMRRAGLADMTLSLSSEFPVGAGLGGSSAAGVAAVGALAAWRGETLNPAALAERSRAIEVEDLGVAGGRQDHYAAAFGGALGLRFTDQVTVDRLPLDVRTTAALERCCTVVYTGQSRISATTITAVVDAYRARESRVVTALARMRALAELMADALRRGDVEELGRLVGEHWVHQRALHPAITTPLIDRIVDCARAAGAVGAKALGASGGGCVLVVAPEARAAQVRAAVSALAEPLTFTIDHDGFRVLARD